MVPGYVLRTIGFKCAGCEEDGDEYIVADDGDPNPTPLARRLLEAHDDEAHGSARCTWVPIVARVPLEGK